MLIWALNQQQCRQPRHLGQVASVAEAVFLTAINNKYAITQFRKLASTSPIVVVVLKSTTPESRVAAAVTLPTLTD